MAHPDQKEAEQLYQTVCCYTFEGGDCMVSFCHFDDQGKPVLEGMDDCNHSGFGRTIEYYPDEKRWKVVNDCGAVEAWSDQEPAHPHLVPETWYIEPGGKPVYDSRGVMSFERTYDWHIRPDMMRRHSGEEMFSKNYNQRAKALIKSVSKRFPGIPYLPLPPIPEDPKESEE